jgi:hypothetical protein
MSLESIGGMVSGRESTAATSSVDAGRPETHRSCVDLQHSFYGILVVITDMGRHYYNRTGATPCRMIKRWPVQNWHDMIGDHTFGDTVLYRLVYYSHWLTLTGGLSHHRRPYCPPVIR